MNRSTAKVQKEGRWKTNLRNNEVDGHFFTNQRFRGLVKEVLAEVLGGYRRRESRFWAVE